MPKRLLIYSNDTTDQVSAKRREGGNEIKDKNNFVLSVTGQHSILSGKHEKCVSHQLKHIFDVKFSVFLKK